MKLPSLFCDNMVLQCGRPIPVWGWAEPGERITVTLAERCRRTVTGKDGKWQVKLPALPPGGPFEMTLCGRQTQTLRNVLIGEVWICSGQSNMQWPLQLTADADEEINRANYPRLRLFTVTPNAVVERQADVTGSWHVCTPEMARTFSAAAYYFGRELVRKLKVPIGLINTSYGGTEAEAWTSRESLVASRLFRPRVERYEKRLKHFKRDQAAYEARLKKTEGHGYPSDPGNTGFAKGWAAEDTPTDDWPTMTMPRAWQDDGLNFSGVLWFRKMVDVPAGWAGRDLVVKLAPCDKCDTTYFNNVPVGGLGTENPNAWCTPRVYSIPGRLVKPGRNVIAVRVYSYAFAGGMLGSADQMNLSLSGVPKTEAIPLAGPWQYHVEHDFGFITPVTAFAPLGPGNPHSPYSLYRGMIEPLIPYAIRGAIWYQGESDADRAYEYRALFPLMIRSWRKAWGQGDFPFLFAQLANYHAGQDRPVESTWAELREAQTMTLQLLKTGMAVTIDIGDASDIHPRNKLDVGRRLALLAFDQVYRLKSVVPSGPLFRSAHVIGQKVRLSFDHVGKGLTARGGKLRGFAIAGRDRKFVWAEAKIDGHAVVVWHPQISKPVAVRYGWADNPVCNLYNKHGLPASPFRTDRWPGLTAPKK